MSSIKDFLKIDELREMALNPAIASLLLYLYDVFYEKHNMNSSAVDSLMFFASSCLTKSFSEFMIVYLKYNNNDKNSVFYQT